MKNLLVALLLGVTMVSVAQEKVLLRLNYEKGDVYEMKMEMSQKMGAGLMSMNTKMTMHQEIKVVSDDTYESDMKITNMVINVSQGGQLMSYDSSKKEEELSPTDEVMKAQMAPMMKVLITTKGDNLGKIIETKVEPNIPNANNLTQQSSNVVYPEKAVSVGDTWSMNKDANGMKLNFVYKVNSITAKNVLLDISGNVEGVGTGNIKGTMNIDKKTGVALTSKIEMLMKVQGQDLTTSMNMSITKK
ncbi:DUF6263 family protein [Tenacibaculum retecalamus]|uniref:DUF6263 family protein n=1 Tax=Tenacibaculum retecalamus TaxID=3018315 RepID=UPI0023D9036E|nr:DUF6263 family protein [Tenacibaculum retecalamus]WBX70302.1 DUF6263 family protein [Tenacibaculum retecalamus]